MVPPPAPPSVAALHGGRDVGRLLQAAQALLLLGAVHEVGHGQARQQHERLVPDHEGGRHGQQEGDVEGVQVLRVHGVPEGQRVAVVVQQHAQPPQLQRGFHQLLLAVVPHQEVVVAAREDPRGRVLAAPLILGCGLVGDTQRVPEESKRLMDKVNSIYIVLFLLIEHSQCFTC